MQGYHFPPQDAQPAYGGYSNPQLLAPQQWPQHGEPQPHEISYQGYGDSDPSPFAAQGHQHQHQGYADSDAEFGEGYYEDEEPRRGRRWLLIAAALVGAIGVGGALAYTYRSIVAPKSRMEAVKTDPGVKVKVGSKEERPPAKIAEPLPPKAIEPPPDDPSPGENQGPRKIKTITITPGSGAQAVDPPATSASAVPGITLYQAPDMPKAPDVPAPSLPSAKKEVVPPPGRVTLGTRPPSPPVEKEAEAEEPPVAEAPPPRKVAVVAPKLPSPAPPRATKEAPSGSGMFVPVLKSEKSSEGAMKAYADLHQRYPEVLGGKSFDVLEADLSARGLGTMYRVVVGPPGSQNWATSVCAQLKAAGYVGCWVKEY
jgi:hypothetical protein